MSTATTQSDPDTAEARPDPFAVHAEERRVMAREAAEIILAVMRATGRQAIEVIEPPRTPDAPQSTEPDATAVETAAVPRRAGPRVDPAERLDRLARGLRLTLTLEAKFEADLRAYLAGEVAKCEATRAKAEADADDPACVVSPFKRVRQGRRGVVRERVVDVIDREIPDPDEHVSLGDALDERLLWDPAYADLDDTPLRDIVEHLCADLKLKTDWRLWQGEGWKTPPFARPRCSPFHQRSAVPILDDDDDDDDPDPLE